MTSLTKATDSTLAERRGQLLEVLLDMKLTDEQKYFTDDFTKSTLSISDPGTGKTGSSVFGILRAQDVHQVQGNKILCLSYTRNAVGEIAGRYEKACKAINKIPSVEFSTFHAFALKMLREVHPELKVKGRESLEEIIPELSEIVSDVIGNKVDLQQTKKIYSTIIDLNSRMIFTKEQIVLNYKFNLLNMSADDFIEIRQRWFQRCLFMEEITQGDIPNFALQGLLSKPEIVEKYKKKYDVIIVDEFQDLSLLQFEVIHLVCGGSFVAIGDMKQQIYGFNGSSLDIVDRYLECYPDARKAPLTQSFRCSNKIASRANLIINDNRPDGFKGVGDFGPGVTVAQLSGSTLDAISNKIRSGIAENAETTSMVLAPTNIDVSILIEKFFQDNIRFYCTKFVKAYELPVITDIYDIMDFITNSYDKSKLFKVIKMFPKNIGYNFAAELSKAESDDYLNYPFTSITGSARTILEDFRQAKAMYRNGSKTADVLRTALNHYYNMCLKQNQWRYMLDVDYALQILFTILGDKTWREFIQQEQDKEMISLGNQRLGTGVRCCTIHSAKGLEADDVYIFGITEGAFPRSKDIDRFLKFNAHAELKQYLVNSANLLYVGVTRAKRSCVIIHTQEGLSELYDLGLDEALLKYGVKDIPKAPMMNYEELVRYFSI